MAWKQTDDSTTIKVNYAGNSLKSMFLSVEDSLTKLRTTYIDILYVHMWDFTTPLEEVMDGLHNLVIARKVLYLVSTPGESTLISLTGRLFLREFLTRLPGSWQRPMSMLNNAARRHSSSIRVDGM